MTASFRIIVGILALSLVTLCAGAESVPQDHRGRAVMISSGAKVILRDDGRVIVFGGPNYHERPELLEGAEDIVSVAGGTTGLALRKDGAVLFWSAKCTNEEQPQCTYPEAKILPKLRPAVAIASNERTHFLVLKDGSVWGWGDDRFGLIGGRAPRPGGESFVAVSQAKIPPVTAPRRLPLPVPINSIDIATQAMAIDADGDVWTWGGLANPSLRGPGEEIARANGFTAVKVAGLPRAKQVVAGIYSAVLTRDGDVWIFGESDINGRPRGTAALTIIPEFRHSVSIASGGMSILAKDTSGRVRCFGLPNEFLRPGDKRAYELQTMPLELPSLRDAIQVSGDGIAASVIHADGHVTYGGRNLDIGD